MKRLFNLVDSSFGNALSITGGKTPKKWVWDRTLKNSDIPIFYNNGRVFDAEYGRENYAILTEPRSLIPSIYSNIAFVIDRFKYVFTHDRHLLTSYPEKCKFIPAGGLWIGGPSGGGEIKLYNKSKKLSIVSSTKSMCELHLFRYQLAVALRYCHDIDVFIANPGNNYLIIETLSDYMYSIAVENHVDELYFTEKVLNCFATGTVPVYLGAQKISKFFDADGIIPFRTWGDLVRILPTLSERDYESRLPAVASNNSIVRNFDNNEDYIADNYGHILPFYPEL